MHRKKVAAAFDSSRLTSGGEVLLLGQAERAMGICRRLAACIADRRDPARVIHHLNDILTVARVFAIACGYGFQYFTHYCLVSGAKNLSQYHARHERWALERVVPASSPHPQNKFLQLLAHEG